MPCSNAAKTRNPLKFVGVPQTTGPISAVSESKFAIYCEDIWRRYCGLTSFFPIVDTCLTCEDLARQSHAMVLRWRMFGDFLRPILLASRVQHVSDQHLKHALRPCVEVWQTSNLRQLRLGEEKKKEDRTDDRMKI